MINMQGTVVTATCRDGRQIMAVIELDDDVPVAVARIDWCQEPLFPPTSGGTPDVTVQGGTP